MKTSKSIKRILMGAALFMLFTGLFTACPQKIKEKKISVDGISLDKNELTINVGESYALSAAISPANANNKKITWTSDKPEIAEVDQNGNVTGKAEGNAVITVTTEDGNKTANCNVTVKFIHIESISLDKNELELGIGESYALSATISPANASNKKITWTSGNSGIAEVDQNGNVTGKAEGNAVITVTTEDGNKTATCTVKVEKGAILILSPDKKDIRIKAVTSSGNITVIGCTQTELTSNSMTATTLNATSDRVILKGDIINLSCCNNKLTNLYVQGLNDLKELYCSGNQLTSLNVQGLNNLEELSCSDNQLTSLNVHGFNNLESLNCSDNQLTSLNVQGLNKLESLNCSKNQLTSLNVQGLNKLESLQCYGNQLTSLNVQGLNKLESLQCYGNPLTSLNVQGLNKLESLNCFENQLTSLNVQGLNNLRSLNCSGNQLTSLDVDGLNNLKSLNCPENQLTSLNVQGLNNLKKLNCSKNQLTSLDVYGLNNLESLNCSVNPLTSLNVQGLNNLESLNCSVNPLTSLNVQGLNNLKLLYCSGNQLTSLDVQGLNNLESLYCSGNQLTSLNVQGLNNLKSLNCSGSQLTSLNVQGLNNLKSLYCGLNKLTKEAFRKLFDDLPARTAEDYARCILYAEITGITEGNYTGFTKEELKVIKDKNWKTYKQTGNNYSNPWEEEEI